ncbi:hypothetical protein AMK22_00230 [Streptomyces sp. CB01580]|nr:hypothetical protein AMK22_00230 [Streptomyces sp. CB01580]
MGDGGSDARPVRPFHPAGRDRPTGTAAVTGTGRLRMRAEGVPHAPAHRIPDRRACCLSFVTDIRGVLPNSVRRRENRTAGDRGHTCGRAR